MTPSHNSQASSTIVDEFEQRYQSDAPTLFAEIGREISKRRLSATPPTLEHLQELGRMWFKNAKTQIASLVCHHELIKTAVSNPQLSNRTQLAAVIIDILMQAKLGVPVATVSALVMKEGLTALCQITHEQTPLQSPQDHRKGD